MEGTFSAGINIASRVPSVSSVLLLCIYFTLLFTCYNVANYIEVNVEEYQWPVAGSETFGVQC